METIKIKNNMKPAIVDQIVLWIVMFLGFVTSLFMIVDYSSIMRIKSDNDTLAQQGARMIALGKTNSEVTTTLNNMRNQYYAVISDADITCDEVVASSFQVIFNVVSTYSDTKVLTFTNTINSKVAAFNEINENEITCTL